MDDEAPQPESRMSTSSRAARTTLPQISIRPLPPDGEDGPFPNIPDHTALWKIGEGGMARVWLVCRNRDQRRFAAKTPKRGHEERFRREIRGTLCLRHANIVRIEEWIDRPDLLCYIMPVYEKPLGSVLEAGPLPILRAARLALRVASGLGHAHEHGIIHRDLKPSNILLRKDGRPVIADFGLVRQQHEPSSLTVTGDPLGTVFYMSPEQARGLFSEVEEDTDLWALGVVLYEMLTGQRPYTGRTNNDVIVKICTGARFRHPRDIRPEIPEALQAIVLKCLRKQRKERYRKAGQVVAALKEFLNR
jgi:serine/threonine-protein kinase